MYNFCMIILTDIKFENDLLNGKVHHTTWGMARIFILPLSSAITATTTFSWGTHEPYNSGR